MTKDILNPSNLKSKNCFKFNLSTLSAEFKGEICLMGVLKSELRWDWNEVSAFAMGHIPGVKFSLSWANSAITLPLRDQQQKLLHTRAYKICLPVIPSPLKPSKKLGLVQPAWCNWISLPLALYFLRWWLGGTLHRAAEESGRKMLWKCW